MPAQLGSTIVLGYGTQGAQQAGAALVLEYAPAVVNTRITSGRRAPWGGAHLVRRTHAVKHPVALHIDQAVAANWTHGADLDAGQHAPWGIAAYSDKSKTGHWTGPMATRQPKHGFPWGKSRAVDDRRGAPWAGPMAVRQSENLARWVMSRAVDDMLPAPWAGPMAVLQPASLVPWGRSARIDVLRDIPWTQYSQQLRPGWMVITPVDPGEPPASLLYILPARFYMSVHNVFAERVSDSAEIPIYDATLSADSGSFCWTFSASGPDSLFTLLAPVDGLPAQIRITVDGLPFVFAVESRRRTESFGKRGVAISGRSVTALVSAPWSRAATHNSAGAQTAQQLAEQALDLSGVALDWGLTDWLVPGGAWQHQGTPLSAVTAIAEAAGGYVQSHRSAPTLLVRHPYPTAPWDWSAGAADVEIAPDALITIGAEEKGGSDLNAVYASGTTAGVLALVKRTGTAGDKLAAMVTDPLITHVDAARQRGLAVLGAGGAKQNITLELPILTGPSEPGILSVGQLVQINAATPWRARVRAVSVAGRRTAPRQTVTLERHLEIA